MKFAITSIAFTVFAALSTASVVNKREAVGYYEPNEDNYTPTTTYDNDYDGYVTTFPHAFALGVKDYYGKTKDLKLVYEIDDGQLEYDDKHPFPIDEECEEDDDKYDHKKPKHDWKRDLEIRGYDSDDDDGYSTFKYPFNKIDKSKVDTWFKLKRSILTTNSGRLGEIVANHQFQADPFPGQPDALFKKGFAIVYKKGDWLLALNKSTKFWNAKVDEYNTFKIYDAPISKESKPIELVIIKVDGKKW